MDSILSANGSKILVQKRLSDTVQETKELLQLHFCIERSLHVGDRKLQLMGSVPLKTLVGLLGGNSGGAGAPTDGTKNPQVVSTTVPTGASVPVKKSDAEIEKMWFNTKFSHDGPRKPDLYWQIQETIKNQSKSDYRSIGNVPANNLLDTFPKNNPNVHINFVKPEECEEDQ